MTILDTSRRDVENTASDVETWIRGHHKG
jgi:hypothetical protein